jgi:phosphatidylglycerol:prolipoprotein diacylglycerol transferase
MNYTWLLNADNPHITIFGFDIYAYAIIIVCGMIAAFFVISLLFRRRNMSADLFLTFFCICLPIAILTTRLFYCITSNMPIEDWFSFESIRQGGLSIIGGIIGGAASVIGVCIVKKVNFFRAGDCIVVGLLLAQCIGRWGNFANQEVYGMVVDNPALQWFPFAVFIDADQSWHYAFFFYESMVTLLAAIALFLNAWFNPKKPNGINTACYFIIYGLTRAIMEPLRDSSFILNGGGIPWSFVFSLVLLAGGLGLLGYVLINNQRKEGQLLGSKDNDPYGITKFIGDTKTEVAYFDRINVMCSVYPENYSTKTKKIDEKIEFDSEDPTVSEPTVSEPTVNEENKEQDE